MEEKNPPSHQNVTPPLGKEESKHWYLGREFKIGVGVLLALGIAGFLP
jgi:hypothetical protein